MKFKLNKYVSIVFQNKQPFQILLYPTISITVQDCINWAKDALGKAGWKEIFIKSPKMTSFKTYVSEVEV